MKYTISIEIERSRDQVAELFADPDNLKHWQPELISLDHQSGEPGQAGGRSLLRMQMGKREMEMIETIERNNLPEEFIAIYEAGKVWNRVRNRFIIVGENKTEWVMESEFRCGGFVRIMAILLPGMFKKQSFKYMEQFKGFVESSS